MNSNMLGIISAIKPCGKPVTSANTLLHTILCTNLASCDYHLRVPTCRFLGPAKATLWSLKVAQHDVKRVCWHKNTAPVDI